MAKPKNCIPVAEAKQLQANWNSTRAIAIEKAQGSKDPIAFTFSLDEMQEFLNYVRDQSATDGVSSPGIRVYVGAYDTEKTDKSTVFLTGCALSLIHI